MSQAAPPIEIPPDAQARLAMLANQGKRKTSEYDSREPNASDSKPHLSDALVR
jgi:hypothetical protein